MTEDNQETTTEEMTGQEEVSMGQDNQQEETGKAVLTDRGNPQETMGVNRELSEVKEVREPMAVQTGQTTIQFRVSSAETTT